MSRTVSPKPRSAERERLLRRLSVAMALMVVFAAAEIGLRLYARLSDYIPKVNLYDAPHHYFGRALVPNAVHQGGRASVHVNSRGFRGKEFEVPKPEGTYRVFALGGSTTFGYYPATTSDATAYPAVLEGLLNQDKRHAAVSRYEVINAGVPGYSLRTSLQNLAGRILYLQPDMVIVYHLTNDLARYGNESNLSHPMLNQFAPAGVASGFLDHVMGWSYAFQELRFSVGRRLLAGLGAGPPSKTPDAGAGWQPDARYLDAFRRDLRNLVILARANGVRTLLATQSIAFTEKTDFTRLTDDERSMRFDHPATFYATVPGPHRHALVQRYNDIIREVAQTESTLLADVDAVIPKTPEYHWDYCHLTDKGTALQAQVIHRVMRGGGPVPAAAAH